MSGVRCDNHRADSGALSKVNEKYAHCWFILINTGR